MKIFYCVLIAAFGLSRLPALGQTVPPPTPPNNGLQPPAQPAEPPHVVAPAPAIPAKPVELSDFLAFDADQKDFVAANGEAQAFYKFEVTNISQEPVTVRSVTTSCGCTTAHLPPMPWVLAPGTGGEINVTMNLAGKNGIVFKRVTVSTDKGNKVLMVKVTVMPRAGNPGNNGMLGMREMNQKVAAADRQAVFKNDCARCHVAPGEGKTGKELYTAVCGVCHEANPRATMVPDLHHLNIEMSRELWEIWINYGKRGTMMPAFAKSEGGPLTENQVQSLADYLAEAMPSRPAAPK